MGSRIRWNSDISMHTAVVGTHTHNAVNFSVAAMCSHVTVPSGVSHFSRQAKEHASNYLSVPKAWPTCHSLKSKVNPTYLEIQSVPRSKHYISVIKTSQFMLCREIIAVCSEIHTKHVNTLCGQNVELLKVKPGSTYSNHWALKD